MRIPSKSIVVVPALALAILAGCGRERPEIPPGAGLQAETAAWAAAPTPPPASGGGATLSGTTRFAGPAPVRKPIKMSADANCAKMHSGTVLSEDTIVDANGQLQNVFVYVKSGIQGSFPPPATPAVLDQKGCMYAPRVTGVQVGQTIRILNSDPTLHNVHALPKKSKEFNIGMPRQGMEITRKFDQPEVMVQFKCDVHPWMASWVGVLPHPYFAVSDAAGAWSIAGLPPGTYTVEAWHAKLGTQSQTVAVTAGAVPAAVEFTFKPPAGS
jgi:plastocyanin